MLYTAFSVREFSKSCISHIDRNILRVYIHAWLRIFNYTCFVTDYIFTVNGADLRFKKERARKKKLSWKWKSSSWARSDRVLVEDMGPQKLKYFWLRNEVKRGICATSVHLLVSLVCHSPRRFKILNNALHHAIEPRRFPWLCRGIGWRSWLVHGG